jgi:transcriptional regulator with XRE-family HTH domain
MKTGLNVVGPQVRRLRKRKGWTQPVLAGELRRQGWRISTGSLGKLEVQLRRVPDCELMFIAKVLGVSVAALFPKRVSLKRLGAEFRSGARMALFPIRGGRP